MLQSSKDDFSFRFKPIEGATQHPSFIDCSAVCSTQSNTSSIPQLTPTTVDFDIVEMASSQTSNGAFEEKTGWLVSSRTDSSFERARTPNLQSKIIQVSHLSSLWPKKFEDKNIKQTEVPERAQAHLLEGECSTEAVHSLIPVNFALKTPLSQTRLFARKRILEFRRIKVNSQAVIRLRKFLAEISGSGDYAKGARLLSERVAQGFAKSSRDEKNIQNSGILGKLKKFWRKEIRPTPLAFKKVLAEKEFRNEYFDLFSF